MRSQGWLARTVHNIKFVLSMLQSKLWRCLLNCHIGEHAKKNKTEEFENHFSQVFLLKLFSTLTSIFFQKHKPDHVISLSKIFQWLLNTSYTSIPLPFCSCFPFFLPPGKKFVRFLKSCWRVISLEKNLASHWPPLVKKFKKYFFLPLPSIALCLSHTHGTYGTIWRASGCVYLT